MRMTLDVIACLNVLVVADWQGSFIYFTTMSFMK